MKPFNAIIVRFSNDVTHSAIEKVLKEVPMNFCASVSSEQRRLQEIDTDKQPWFSSSNLRGCQYDDVDWNDLLPLDEELIQGMYKCESMYMHMVARTEKSRQISYRERKRTYLKHLRFWNDFIQKHNINLFLSAWVPHEVPDYIIYALCKYRGIPTVMFLPSPILNYEAIFCDVEASDVRLRDRYHALLDEYKGKPIEDIVLGEEFEAYFSKQKQQEGKKAYTWPDDPTKLQLFFRAIQKDPLGVLKRFLQYIITLISPRTWYRRVQKVLGARRENMLHNFYCKNATTPDFSKKFIYAPLQLQPECSTCPMGGGFMDQELVLQMLSHCVDDGILIYVKEHPLQKEWSHACRSINFYQDLLAIPNVRFMPPNTDSFSLREHCIAVATGTGTAGFEAIFRGKPVLMFGHYIYQYAPGVYSIRTNAECQKAMKEICSGTSASSLRESRLYLKAMEDTLVHAALSVHHQRVSTVLPEDMAQNIADALVREIQNESS